MVAKSVKEKTKERNENFGKNHPAFFERASRHPAPFFYFQKRGKNIEKEGIELRTCKNCGERKTFKAFKRDKNAPSGKSHICRACENQLAEEVVDENTEDQNADVQ